jgi:inner membrane protein
VDSVSQFVLGAAVGGVVLGHRAGAKALLWGGIVATIPDLDVFVPLGDPVSDFTYHRSASHSIFILTLITPLVAWLILRIHPGERERKSAWLGMVWLALITHVLLDCFTIYGTQIFWPLWPEPVAWGTVFIVDPLYTVPLLVAVAGGFWLRRDPQRIRRWSTVGLVISSGYLAFTVGAKVHVERVVAETLEEQGIAHAHLLTGPTFFNTILWRTVVMTDGAYLEGFYSLLDPGRELQFNRYPTQPELLNPVQDSWAVQRLAWFTKGFYRVTLQNEQVTMTDLRMGQEPFYVFSFVVAHLEGEDIVPVPNERNRAQRPSPAALREVWTRIFSGPDYSMNIIPLKPDILKMEGR